MARKRLRPLKPDWKTRTSAGKPLPGRTQERDATPPYPEPQGPWYLHAAIVLGLILLNCLLYQGDLDLGFLRLDDPDYVTSNPWITAFNSRNLQHVLTQPYFANYSPLHLLSYMVDYAIGGADPKTFHLSSNLWAGGVAAGIYLLGLGVFGRFWAALAAAILFTVHPAHVEVVAWISSRKDIVAAAFALPSVWTYLQYRRGQRFSRGWYACSLLLFLLAIAGKLSVATLPALLLAFDYFVEKRKDLGILLDKIPFGLIVVLFAARTWGAQPPTGHEHDIYITGHCLWHNLWLLSGFGQYALNRGRPEIQPGIAAFLPVLLAGLLFLLPWLLRKKIPPLLTVFIYWILLSLVPALVLSFVHPVADRYLFFPSAGVALLLGWILSRATSTPLKRGFSPPVKATAIVLFVVALAWSRNTLSYLGEWRDPRSLWYAATTKSSDVSVFQYLGAHYQNVADQLPTDLQTQPVDHEKAAALAQIVWADDHRLQSLLEEWRSPKPVGPQTTAFQKHLRQLAMAEYQKALQIKTRRIMPNLYFRLGKLAVDTGDTERARAEFHRALEESEKQSFEQARREVQVRTHHALGVTYWQERNYPEAMKWIRMAEEEQTQYGGNWIADITQQREKLQALLR